MWVELFCGFMFYKLFRRFFTDDIPDLEPDSDVKPVVANRLKKIYGGTIYIGLRIPDPDSGSRQNIDMVLVNKGEVNVITVKNLNGFVELDADGSWICSNGRKKERHPDPVEETTRQVAILESYLEQRGTTLPKGGIVGRVILPNPNCRTSHSIDRLPEVISFENWAELKPESRSGFSNWIKDMFHAAKNEMKDGIDPKLHFVLSTAPMWDRLEFKGDRYVLGEFMDFKGRNEDVQALRSVKRSKVSRLIIQKSAMFEVLGGSKVQVLYIPRDYRTEASSASELSEATVRSHTELVFQPLNSKKSRKFKLSAVVSLSLSPA